METDIMKNGTRSPANSVATLQRDEKNMAAVAHAGGILFGFIPALIIWLMEKEESPFVSQNAKEALNFQITIAIAFLISFILIFVLIGVLLIWLVWMADIFFCIMAAVKSAKGESYRYPIAIRLIH